MVVLDWGRACVIYCKYMFTKDLFFIWPPHLHSVWPKGRGSEGIGVGSVGLRSY